MSEVHKLYMGNSFKWYVKENWLWKQLILKHGPYKRKRFGLPILMFAYLGGSCVSTPFKFQRLSMDQNSFFMSKTAQRLWQVYLPAWTHLQNMIVSSNTGVLRSHSWIKILLQSDTAAIVELFFPSEAIHGLRILDLVFQLGQLFSMGIIKQWQ